MAKHSVSSVSHLLCPTQRQPSHFEQMRLRTHGLIGHCLLLVSPLLGAADRPQDIDTPLSSPQIYPNRIYIFSERTEARWFGSTRL